MSDMDAEIEQLRRQGDALIAMARRAAGTVASTGFARPFRVTYPDGVVEHGVQFPDGRCVIALHAGGFHAAMAFEHIGLEQDAVAVEWADGGGQAGGDGS